MKLLLGDQAELFKQIPDNSIDAVITDPPYGVLTGHKIETGFDWDIFANNCFRVLKKGGFLVYTGQEPTMSGWNVKTYEIFKWVAELIWRKSQLSSPFGKIKKRHEKIIIVSKGQGVLNSIKIDKNIHYKEQQEFIKKESYQKLLNKIFDVIKNCQNLEDLKNDIFVNHSFSNRLNREKGDDIYKSYKVDSDGILGKSSMTSYLGEASEDVLDTVFSTKPENCKSKINTTIIKHPTVKPLELFRRLILLTTKEGDTVLDPFLGSGTTAIACKQTNRKCIGFELYPEYFKLAQDRLTNILI